MIGLDISDRSIKVVEIADSENRKLRSVAWTAMDAAVMRRGIVQDIPAVTASLQAALAKCQPRPSANARVVASIPETQSFVRVLEVPLMSDNETDEAIQWAIREHIPFDLDSVYLNWQPAPLPARGGYRYVVVGAAQRGVVDPLLQVLDTAGLNVVALELESQALIRSLLPRDGAEIRGVLLIDLGATSTNIVFFDQGVMRFTTSLQRGGDDLTEKLSKDLHVSASEAAEKKALIGMEGAPADAQIVASLRDATAQIVQQIARVVQEFTAQLPPDQGLRAILLAGGAANLRGIEEIFAEIFPGVPVQFGNPSINISTGDEQSGVPLSAADAAHFTTAIGAALREERRAEINLLPTNRRKSLAKSRGVRAVNHMLGSVILSLIIATLGAAVALGVLSAISYTKVATTQEQLQVAVKEYQSVRDTIAQQNAFLEYVNGIDERRMRWSDFLNNFLVTVPPGVEIATMGGTAQRNDDGTVEPPIFSFSGQAAARSTLTIFAERLRLLPKVARVESPTSNLIQRENPVYRFTLELINSSDDNAQPAPLQSAL